MVVSKTVLAAYIAACEERKTDPRRSLEYFLVAFVERTGYAQAARRFGAAK